MDKTPKNKIDNEEEMQIKENAKKQALEKVKQKIVIVNIDDIAEAEAHKVADANMTESKESLKGAKGLLKKIWKHTFFDEYYRQKEINKAHENIKNTGNIYSGRVKENSNDAHENAMHAITERFTSEYEGTLSKGEEKKIIDSKDPETLRVKNDINKLIIDYAKGSLDDEALKNEKNRILGGLNKENQKGGNTYTDNLFEIAKNARIAIEHGANIKELGLDTDFILGKAKSSLKTEAHFNNVDKVVDKMKQSKIGRFISPAALNTSVGLAYSLSVGLGTKALRSKAASYGTFGAAVAVSSVFTGINESQRLARERAQHNIEMAEGGEFEEGSKKREQMEKFEYQMESSEKLASDLRSLMFEKDKDGKETIKEVNKDDLQNIFTSLANIEARNSLSAKNKIDLISYSSIGNVEKERTDLTILVARTKVELRKRLGGDLSQLPNGENQFDLYLEKQISIVENSLLNGEKGITEQDKAFSKFKTKEVAKKIAKTAVMGLIVGGAVQEGVAFFKDDVQGAVEGIFHHDLSATTQTPFEHIRSWMAGNSSHMGNGNFIESNLNGHTFKLPEGSSILQNSDGTYNILRGDQIISDHIPLNFDTNGNIDMESMSRLGGDGIISSASHNIINSTNEVTENAHNYINNHSGSVHHIARDGWYDNNTNKPIFEQNELKLHWGGDNGSTGIDTKGNYVFNVSHMTNDGSFHQQFSVDAQEQIKKGGLKMVLSLTQGTQHQVFEVPVDTNGNAVIDPNSEIGKLFFSTENGHAVFKGRFAEVVQSFGEKNGVEHVKSLATLVGNGNDSIIDNIPSHIDVPVTDINPSFGVESPYFIPVPTHSPLESLKEKQKEEKNIENKNPDKTNKKIVYLSKYEKDAIFQRKIQEIRISKGADYIMTQEDVAKARKETDLEIANTNKLIKKENQENKNIISVKSEIDVSLGKEIIFNKKDLSKSGTEFESKNGTFKVINSSNRGIFNLFDQRKITVKYKNKEGVENIVSYNKKDLERELENGNIKITKVE